MLQQVVQIATRLLKVNTIILFYVSYIALNGKMKFAVFWDVTP